MIKGRKSTNVHKGFKIPPRKSHTYEDEQEDQFFRGPDRNKQDRPTKGDAAFNKKHPFQSGMEAAKKSDRLRGKYLDDQMDARQDVLWPPQKDYKTGRATPFDTKKSREVRHERGFRRD